MLEKMFTVIKRYSSQQLLLAVILASVALLCLEVVWYSTPGYADNQNSNIAGSDLQILNDEPLATSPTLIPFLDMIPGSDGPDVFISAEGVGELGGIVFANLFDIGPSSHDGGWAMIYSDTIQAYHVTAVGFSSGVDDGGRVSITTTLGLNSAEFEFMKAFVEASKTDETIIFDGGHFIVSMPEPGAILPDTDTYLLVASTAAIPPDPLPPGYRLIGKTYNMRSSGALVESNKFMTLKLGYHELLPNDSDPHTLTVVRWNRLNHTWDILDGDLFDDEDQLIYATKRFAVYALATSPAWRDSFNQLSLRGVSARINTQWGPGDAIILATGATSGAVTSIPITPTTEATAWGTLHFSATTPANTALTVDILDSKDDVVMNNAGDGTDLSGLSLATYPSLKLRATLTSTAPPQTPALNEWRVNWEDLTLSPPFINTISPISASNTTTTTLTVRGSVFTGTTQIRLGDSFTLPTTFVSTQTLTGEAPAGLTPGSYDVSVINPDGQSATLADGFTVVASTPYNQPPLTPASPTPTDEATDVPLTQTLSWQGGDPDGDPVTYTVVLTYSTITGTGNLPLPVTTTTVANYTPGNLISNTTYYWLIAATDGLSTTTGPTWRFTTADSSARRFIYLPVVLKGVP